MAKTILLVDDDPAIHHLLATMLGASGRRIDSAFSGEDALARIERFSYDLVVTDVRMPGMDGLEMLRRIRQVRPETRVVVMTGDSTPDHIISAIRDRAYSYFSKPFEPQAVSEMIRQALEAPAGKEDIVVLSARPQWIALKVRCSPRIADELIQFLRELKMDLPMRERESVVSAFREILMNAIEHGCRSDPTRWMQVAYVRTRRSIIYYLRDPGPGFSFDDLPHAAISNPPESPTNHVEYRSEHGIRPGGFGILMARNLVDELVYNEKGNEVVLIKYLPESD